MKGRLSHIFTNILEQGINHFKGGSYHLDCSVSVTIYINEVVRRSTWLMRGLIKILLLQRRIRPVFIAPNVYLKNTRMIKFSRGVTLEHGVIIDGLSRIGVELGANVKIGPYSIIRSTGVYSNIGEGVRIGANSGIDAFAFIGAAGGVYIGNNVIMGQHVSFHAEEHIYDKVNILIREQGVTRKGITIGDDCWIGANVTILDGSHIGKGCVIGACSLVNGHIPEYSVAAGVPARVVKSRRITLTNNEA